MLSLMNRFFSIFLLALYIMACLFLISYCETPANSLAGSSVSQGIPTYAYKVLGTYSHDQHAFTQGLIFDKGVLYESTGLRGRSELRKTELETGRVLRRHSLSSQMFGEGLTLFGNRLIQLTWQENTGFVYDKESFRLIRSFSYPGEGWGLTHDGSQLIMSDGTSFLYFLDPKSFRRVGRIRVCDDRGPVVRLNELEYVRGEIYANVWQTDQIVRIDPRSGEVVGRIELGGILSSEDRTQRTDVLNGIAYDAKKDRVFVTGKLWPKLFEIELSQGP